MHVTCIQDEDDFHGYGSHLPKPRVDLKRFGRFQKDWSVLLSIADDGRIISHGKSDVRHLLVVRLEEAGELHHKDNPLESGLSSKGGLVHRADCLQCDQGVGWLREKRNCAMGKG